MILQILRLFLIICLCVAFLIFWQIWVETANWHFLIGSVAFLGWAILFSVLTAGKVRVK